MGTYVLVMKTLRCYSLKNVNCYSDHLKRGHNMYTRGTSNKCFCVEIITLVETCIAILPRTAVYSIFQG